MSLYSALAPDGPTGFGYGSTAEEVVSDVDLTGKKILITGCNSGLGFETMRVLSARGAIIVGLARTVEKAEKAGAEVDGEVIPVACELSEPESVLTAAATVRGSVEELDAMVCNAGIMALPDLNLSHGYELQFFTNHVGHFILVTGLLDKLADDGRAVILSSEAHRQCPSGGVQFDNLKGEKSYSGWRAYGQSKLCNILFAKELARRLEGTNQTANALHPGVIQTNLARHMNPLVRASFALGNPLFLKSVPEGAATQTYVAAHPDAAGVSGEYWSDCNIAKPNKYGRDAELAKRLWQKTEEIVEEVT